MNVVMHVSATDLERRIKSAKCPRLRQRLRIVFFAVQGKSANVVAERVQLSRRRVQEWVYRFNEFGPDGLKDQKGRGRKLPLNDDQIAQLKQRLDAGPCEEDGVCVFTGREIQQIIKDEFGVQRSVSSIYYLLHAIGYSRLVPRPQHPQADLQKQRDFKKGTPCNAR